MNLQEIENEFFEMKVAVVSNPITIVKLLTHLWNQEEQTPLSVGKQEQKVLFDDYNGHKILTHNQIYKGGSA